MTKKPSKKQKPIITKAKPKSKSKPAQKANTSPKTFTVADAMAGVNAKPRKITTKPSKTTTKKAPIEGELLPKKQPDAIPRKLNGRQLKFVQAYVIGQDATKAAISAGYSKRSAKQIGNKLLTIVDLKAEIAERGAILAENAGVTDEKLMGLMAARASSDVRKLFNEDGSLVPICELDDDTASAIESIEIIERTGMGKGITEFTKKIKLVSKNSNVDMLNKILGLYDADNSQRAGTGGAAVFTGIEITFVEGSA